VVVKHERVGKHIPDSTNTSIVDAFFFLFLLFFFSFSSSPAPISASGPGFYGKKVSRERMT
jgi:hypothetical protein